MSIPQNLLEIANNYKFADLYSGPVPKVSQPNSLLQTIIDALLSLDFNVKDVHKLMKTISVIANL